MRGNALQHLAGRLGQPWIGPRALTLIGQALHSLLQSGLGSGALGAIGWSLQAHRSEVIQLANRLDPLKHPGLTGRMACRQRQEIPALVRPAVGQHDPGMQARELLVRSSTGHS